jgi:hypothetical protein
VGTVNFTALPAVAACELFYSSFDKLLASNAWRMAGPAALTVSPVPNAPESIAHTMPSVVADEAEIDGVAPENPNTEGVCCVGVVLNLPVAESKAKLSPGNRFVVGNRVGKK